MISIVNCTKDVCTHYCGRKTSFYRALGNPVDLSVLGNPFAVGLKYSLNESYNKYVKWLWDQMNGDNLSIMKALVSIPDDAVLGCFCWPKKCHCTVIRNAVYMIRDL